MCSDELLIELMTNINGFVYTLFGVTSADNTPQETLPYLNNVTEDCYIWEMELNGN